MQVNTGARVHAVAERGQFRNLKPQSQDSNMKPAVRDEPLNVSNLYSLESLTERNHNHSLILRT